MADIKELEAAPRTVTGKATKRLRKAGIVPAHVFGRGEESETIQIDAKVFEQFLRSHSATNIITLKLPSHTQTVLLRHLQHAPTTSQILHADFFRLTMEERIRVKLPLHFVGESLAVKVEGGVLLHLLEAVDVESLASDLVERLDVDISSLTHIGDILHAKDIVLPQGYILFTDADESIVKVAGSRAEAVSPTATTSTEAQATTEGATGA